MFPRSSVSRYLPSAATREAASWPAAVLPELIMKDGSLFKKKKKKLLVSAWEKAEVESFSCQAVCACVGFMGTW